MLVRPVVAAAAALVVMSLRPRRRLAPPTVMFDAPLSDPAVGPTFAQLAISPDGHFLAVAPTFEGRAPILAASDRLVRREDSAWNRGRDVSVLVA